MELNQKIATSQIRYYNYTNKCIDAYLQDDKLPLKTFLINVSKLGRGDVVLGDQFKPLVDAYKKDDVKMLRYLYHQFEYNVKKIQEEVNLE